MVQLENYDRVVGGLRRFLMAKNEELKAEKRKQSGKIVYSDEQIDELERAMGEARIRRQDFRGSQPTMRITQNREEKDIQNV